MGGPFLPTSDGTIFRLFPKSVTNCSHTIFTLYNTVFCVNIQALFFLFFTIFCRISLHYCECQILSVYTLHNRIAHSILSYVSYSVFSPAGRKAFLYHFSFYCLFSPFSEKVTFRAGRLKSHHFASLAD